MHIKNTNFIVDDFRYSRRNKLFRNYIYFLSHMHGGKIKRSLQRNKQYIREWKNLLSKKNWDNVSFEVSGCRTFDIK